jgi:hypothetical protein
VLEKMKANNVLVVSPAYGTPCVSTGLENGPIGP